VRIDTSKSIPGNVATIEHKEPISRGGERHSPENKTLACYACNTDKGNLTEREYRAVLAYRKSLLNN
jgi:5-methylcytosine-specific restriction endonuclease McrA